jgi:hypothetical protein
MSGISKLLHIHKNFSNIISEASVTDHFFFLVIPDAEWIHTPYKHRARMVNKHIERPACRQAGTLMTLAGMGLHVCNCEYLIINRIQDVYEPWLAPDTIYD